MKKINILGITLCDYTLRESMRLVDVYLKNGALNTIACVTTQMIVKAGEDPEQKEWLESMDMTVCYDEDILRAAGAAGWNRMKEIENDSFLKEFIKKVAREKRTVYLLSDTDENLELLEEKLKRIQENISVAGRSIYAETDTAGDQIVNDINDIAPSVIVSFLPYPVQEAFMFKNRNMINGDIWIGLRMEHKTQGGDKKKLNILCTKIRGKMFQRKVHKYNEQEKAE